jgi:hypothetical protein
MVAREECVMDWRAIVTAVILSVLGSSGLFCLWIRHRFNINLVKYEAGLKKTHDKEVESLKADLRVAAYERETRYHVLQTKRAEVIAEVYQSLTKLQRDLGAFVNIITSPGDPSKLERAETARESGRVPLVGENRKGVSSRGKEKAAYRELQNPKEDTPWVRVSQI